MAKSPYDALCVVHFKTRVNYFWIFFWCYLYEGLFTFVCLAVWHTWSDFCFVFSCLNAFSCLFKSVFVFKWAFILIHYITLVPWDISEIKQLLFKNCVHTWQYNSSTDVDRLQTNKQRMKLMPFTNSFLVHLSVLRVIMLLSFRRNRVNGLLQLIHLHGVFH